MPITYSGRTIRRDGIEYPSLVDIAVGTSRQPRFAGQGRRWYSVLDHLLFGDALIARASSVPVIGGDDVEARRNWRLAWLLHDAHEAITADVPTTFKNEQLKYDQKVLDRGIMGAFFPGGIHAYNFPDVSDAVKLIDRRAMAAEARVIGPDVSAERILHAFGVSEDTPDDISTLQELLYLNGRDWFAVPPFADKPQLDHPGVREYLRRVMDLL